MQDNATPYPCHATSDLLQLRADELRRQIVIDARVAEAAAGFGDAALRATAALSATRRAVELRRLGVGA